MAKRNRPAPAGMSDRAKQLWRSTLSTYDLAEHELHILEAACRELDLVRQMEKALQGTDLFVRGSMGQDVANPLLAELRQHRAAYVSLMKSLKLPDAEEEQVPNPRRASAQAAANARWSRGA